MCVTTVGVLISFIDSALAVQLDYITNGKFTKAQIGAYFVFAVGFYTVNALLWGCELSKNHAMIIGHILILAIVLLIGLVPFIFGISIGLFQVPVIGAMQMYATETGLENGMSLNSIQTSIDIRTIYLMYKYWKHNWTHNWRVFSTLFNIPLDEPSLGNYHFH